MRNLQEHELLVECYGCRKGLILTVLNRDGTIDPVGFQAALGAHHRALHLGRFYSFAILAPDWRKALNSWHNR